MKELEKARMTVFELGGVEPNSHHTTVNKGVQICKKGIHRCGSAQGKAKRK